MLNDVLRRFEDGAEGIAYTVGGTLIVVVWCVLAVACVLGIVLFCGFQAFREFLSGTASKAGLYGGVLDGEEDR